MKFSANIGFLWEHLDLPDRILAADKAGFDAVEFHFPYAYSASDIRAVLNKTDLSVVGINTKLGPDGAEDFGVAALPDREDEAREYIDLALEYACTIGAANINVVAGVTNGAQSSEVIYQRNLRYACEKAALVSKSIVIEPLNPRAVSGYHFHTVEQAVSTIDAVACDNLKLMFDVFHAQIVQGDITTLIDTYASYFGHVQVSAVHDRGEPDVGEINYQFILEKLKNAGYQGYIGAEYKPRGSSVEAGLGWLSQFRSI